MMSMQHNRMLTICLFHYFRHELSNIMQSRSSEIDVKLLLFAIQRTTNFESLVAKRFSGGTLLPAGESPTSSAPDAPSSEGANPFIDSPDVNNPFAEDMVKEKAIEIKVLIAS